MLKTNLSSITVTTWSLFLILSPVVHAIIPFHFTKELFHLSYTNIFGLAALRIVFLLSCSFFILLEEWSLPLVPWFFILDYVIVERFYPSHFWRAYRPWNDCSMNGNYVEWNVVCRSYKFTPLHQKFPNFLSWRYFDFSGFIDMILTYNAVRTTSVFFFYFTFLNSKT